MTKSVITETVKNVTGHNQMTETNEKIENHGEILERLLTEIKPVSFKDIIGLKEDENLKLKHIIYSVVRHVLNTAKMQNWNLCMMYNYIYIYNGAFWRQCGKEDIRKFLTDSAVKMGMKEHEAKYYETADKLLKQFLCDAHLSAPNQNKDKILINLKNGTFEFTPHGWKKKKFNSDDFLTYQLPFNYDDKAECLLFEKYLVRVLPDPNSRSLLQEFMGSIFTKLNFEKCLVLYGDGCNGKSVFMNIMNALFGNENVLNYSLGLFAHEYNRAKLVNVLFNYSSEKGFDLNPDIFKALISGEPIQAREIYQKPFTLHNLARFIINCNELPRETEITEAYFRRFIIIPFEVKITNEERDVELADKIIKNEMPGIFNWVLEGLNRFATNKKFSNSVKSEGALFDFRKQSDSVQLFIDEKKYICAKTKKEPLSVLYAEYKEFCREDNYRPLGKNRFSKRLEKKGLEKTRDSFGSAAFFVEVLVPHGADDEDLFSAQKQENINCPF